MSDQKTAVGICTEISERSGWTTFHVDAGTKYPLRLATKKTEIVDAARALGQTIATWTYTEKESETINEHTGKPYINRYLEAVSTDGVLPSNPAPASAEPHQPASKPLLGGDKDRAITRMACLKAAAETFNAPSYTWIDPSSTEMPDGALEVMKIATRYENWVMRDIDPIPFQ